MVEINLRFYYVMDQARPNIDSPPSEFATPHTLYPRKPYHQISFGIVSFFSSMLSTPTIESNLS